MLAPLVALAPAKLHAIEPGKKVAGATAATIKKDQKSKRVVRAKTNGRAMARIVEAVRVQFREGKTRISAKTRATRRVDPRGALIFDLQ